MQPFKKKQPEIKLDVINSLLSGALSQEFKSFKAETKKEVDEVLTETKDLNKETKQSLKEVKSTLSKMNTRINDNADEIVSILSDIKSNGLKGDPGEPGETVDEEALEEKILAKVPKLEEIVNQFPTKEEIVNEVIKQIPENKPSLKIIQEAVDIDKVTEKVTENLQGFKKELQKDLKMEISRNQRYQQVSGGGFSNIANVTGTVSTGLSTLKFTGSGVNSVTQSGQTVTVDISGGGGGGTPGGSTTQLQYNNAGSFGGISGATTDGTIVTYTTGNLKVADIKASSSAGIQTLSNNGTVTALQGAGGGANNTFYGSIKGDYLTASEMVITDASKNIVSAPAATYPNLTELSYVKGVTSSIQTQLNTKGTGDALTSNPLSQFASTTSAQLANIISDETGSGSLVFGTTPTITTPVLNGIPTGTGVSTTNTPNTLALRTSSGYLKANNTVGLLTTTATSGGTTTLDDTSTKNQVFTGSSNQTLVLPSTGLNSNGVEFYIINNSTGIITIKTSTSVDVMSLPPLSETTLTQIAGGNLATSWNMSKSYLMSGIITNYVEKTTTYSITRSDYTINCTSGTFTVTLPTAVGITGQMFVIKNSGAGTITIDTTSSQTIDGSLTKTLSTQYSTYTVQSTGSNWIII